MSRSPGAVAHHRHHRHPLRGIYGVGLLLLLVVLLGWAGFRYTTGFSWFNSLYLTVSVLSTNGYTGELGDLTPHTKMLSMVLIVLGGGVFVYSITQITTVLMDEETRRYFGLQTQLRKVRRMENHMIVCGLGRVGVAVCQEFAKNGQEFLLVERDPGRLEKAAGNGWATMPGDATEDRTLEQAGIAKARGLVACVESDAANLFIVISARGLNDHMEIFSRVSDEANISKFKRAGVTHVYSPYALLGRTIARNVDRPRVQKILNLAQEHSYDGLTIEEREVGEDSPMAGRTLLELELRGRYDAVVFAIIGSSQKIVHNPGPDTEVRAGDTLILLGPPDRLERLTTELKLK